MWRYFNENHIRRYFVLDILSHPTKFWHGKKPTLPGVLCQAHDSKTCLFDGTEIVSLWCCCSFFSPHCICVSSRSHMRNNDRGDQKSFGGLLCWTTSNTWITICWQKNWWRATTGKKNWFFQCWHMLEFEWFNAEERIMGSTFACKSISWWSKGPQAFIQKGNRAHCQFFFKVYATNISCDRSFFPHTQKVIGHYAIVLHTWLLPFSWHLASWLIL